MFISSRQQSSDLHSVTPPSGSWLNLVQCLKVRRETLSLGFYLSLKHCSKILGENVFVIQGVTIGKRQTMWGSLNIIGYCNPKGCGLVKVGVALLGEVYHCRGRALRELKLHSVSDRLLPVAF